MKILISNEERNFLSVNDRYINSNFLWKKYLFSYWWVGDNLQSTEKLKANDKAGERQPFGNLGIAYDNLCDFNKAIEHHERDLQIAKEVGDKAGERRAYGNLGNAYHRLSDFHKAIEYHECDLKITK